MSPLSVPLGKSGLSSFPLAFGMWRLQGPAKAAQVLIETALESGVTLFDTAAIYGVPFGGAEAVLGEVLKSAPHLRQSITLATKAGITPPIPYDSSARHLIESCEASLRRLNVEVIDLFQIHRPDHLAHPHEVAAALSHLRQSGKIREAGVSNYTAPQTRALIAHLDFPLTSLQPEFSALAIEALSDGVLDLATELDLAVLAWSPLARGAIPAGTGLPRAPQTVAALDAVAARLGVSREAVAYAFIMTHPARPIPIIGSTRPERVREAAAGAHLRLNRADWYAILVAARGAPMP